MIRLETMGERIDALPLAPERRAILNERLGRLKAA
jgi:hypothetical protein